MVPTTDPVQHHYVPSAVVPANVHAVETLPFMLASESDDDGGTANGETQSVNHIGNGVEEGCCSLTRWVNGSVVIARHGC